MKRPKVTMVLVPPDQGRKQAHLVLVTHRGGGWYEAACMGQARACREGTCKHAEKMRWADSVRPIRQVARA